MDGSARHVRGDGGQSIDGLAEHVHETSEQLLPDGNADGCARRFHRCAPAEALGEREGHGAHPSHIDVLLHLEDDGRSVAGRRPERLAGARQRGVGELDVDHGTPDPKYGSLGGSHGVPPTSWAPEAISRISLVMASWRRVRPSARSSSSFSSM